MPCRELPPRTRHRDAATERRGQGRLSRPFSDVRALLGARARARRNPFTHTDPDTACAILRRLDSTEHEPWVAAFMDEAQRHERRGDWLQAYGYARVARYPAPTSPPKREAYDRSRDLYLRATRDADPPIQCVAIPFRSRPGEGASIPVHLRRPRREGPVPVVVCWGGIDAFKEDRRTDAYLAEGWATVAMDMPGTGEAPIAGSEDAERLWDDVLDWIQSRDDLDAKRVAFVGSSTGGYWAAKLAHTHRERISACVDHGGPAHHAFERRWIERAETGEYPFEYAESLASAFGRESAADWVAYAPALSLLAQGMLDRPCGPLLLVGGRADTVFPPADLQLLLSRGAPVSARLFPGGHMGEGDTTGAIVTWLRESLARGAD